MTTISHNSLVLFGYMTNELNDKLMGETIQMNLVTVINWTLCGTNIKKYITVSCDFKKNVIDII